MYPQSVFPMLLVFLLLATGVAAFRLRQAITIGNRRVVWVSSAVGLPMLLLTFAAMWLLIRYPTLASRLPASGFSAEWQCATYDKGSKVCFKNDSPKADAGHLPSPKK